MIPQPLRSNTQGISKNPLKSADFRGGVVGVPLKDFTFRLSKIKSQPGEAVVI